MNRIDLLTNRRAVLRALLTILLVGAAPALAQGPDFAADEPEPAELTADDDGDGSFGPGGGMRFERLARRLGLNDEQREAVAGIHESGRARDLPLRKQLRQLRHEMQGEMMKDSPSEKVVVALVREMGELRTKIQTGHLQDRLAVRGLLTAEQRDQWLMSGEHRRGSRRGGGGGSNGRHGGPRWHDHRGPHGDGTGPQADCPVGGPGRRAGSQSRNTN